MYIEASSNTDKSIYIGKIVISNQAKIKLKSKSMDYVDK